MKFETTPDQDAKIKAWANKQDKIVLEEQRKKFADPEARQCDPFLAALADDGIAYYGAIGGELEYCFSPTSVGDVLVVKHSRTGAEINVTDYESW